MLKWKERSKRMKRTKQLRRLLEKPGIIITPGAYDAISARILEYAGFEAIAITGGGISRSKGISDNGLLTMTEVLDQTRFIVDAVKIPVVADCDTGYGNAINLIRTVKEFERVGVAGFFFEDQETPKKCGKYAGIRLISPEEMIMKIQAAVDTRKDPDLLIIARTMAGPMEGVKGLIKRGNAYARAGADVIKVRGLKSIEDIKKVAQSIDCPLGINWPDLQGKSFEDLKSLPGIKSAQDFAKFGYKMMSFPSDLMRAAMKAMMEAATVLRKEGTMEPYAHRQVKFADRERLIGTYELEKLEEKYLL
jgi:2-methylisocitrate lyase-like PEP mutase family enzyme